MKHKRFDMLNWHRWGTGSVSVKQLPGGVLADFQAQTVRKTLSVPFKGREIRIFDEGYRWVHYAPQLMNHAVTVQLDAMNIPQQIYVDICAGHGLDPYGVPYVNDLYLDVIALCDVPSEGNWVVTASEIIDVDDLNEALGQGQITEAQAELAWAEAFAVQKALQAQAFTPLAVVREYLRRS